MANKATYRTRNWTDYNRSLIARGDITLWVNNKTIKEWHEEESSTKRGRPRIYSNTAIITFLVIKALFQLDLRRTQGLLQSMFKMFGWKVTIPSYTQVCRRQTKVQLPKLPTSRKPIHLVIDSSGLKVYGEGEWKVRQHGYQKRRTWRKIHIGVDEGSHFIVCAELTSNSCGDDKLLPTLMSEYRGKIKQVSADGAYDSHANFETIKQRGAIPTIPTQPNPTHKKKKKSALRDKVRDHVAWQIQRQGRKSWKKASGYHRRSLAETSFFRLKKILGGSLRARSFENQRTEALLRCAILNQMTAQGMPVSYRVS